MWLNCRVHKRICGFTDNFFLALELRKFQKWEKKKCRWKDGWESTVLLSLVAIAQGRAVVHGRFHLTAKKENMVQSIPYWTDRSSEFGPSGKPTELTFFCLGAGPDASKRGIRCLNCDSTGPFGRTTNRIDPKLALSFVGWDINFLQTVL
jgi:hypothetical protein